jgi:general secretion pathway protein L
MAIIQPTQTQPRALQAQLGAALSNFGAWWLEAFLALWPEPMARWLMDRGARNLLLQKRGDDIVCALRNERGGVLAEMTAPAAGAAQAIIGKLLQKSRLAPKDVAVGLEIAPEKIFRREILLPLAAANAIPAIAAQDLARKTPLRLDDVHHDHAARRNGQTIIVSQVVIRRQFVEEAAMAYGVDVADIAFLEIAGAAGGGEPSLLRLRPTKAHANWLLKVLLGMAATAILLALLAVSMESRRQQAVLDEIAAQLTTARAQAQAVRTTLEKAQQERTVVDQLRARKWAAPGILDIWEELSRVLPAHSWLTEIRIAESPEKKDRKIVLTGFSAAAADLVPLIDKSPLFQDVALAAPIALDPAEQRERFVLQAAVSSGQPAVQASR